MPELKLKPGSQRPVGAKELKRRAEALDRHRADANVRSVASAGELARLRAQLRVAARLSARLAATHDIDEMLHLIVEELHQTFAFYLAAIQRLGENQTLQLVAAAGPLAEVMTEFLLIEQPVELGVNGQVARTGVSSLVPDTRDDPLYIVRDPETDPQSELSVAIVVDGSVWGVLNIEAVEPRAFTETDVVLVETIAASLGAAIHRAGLITDLERTLTTTLAVLTSTVEAKDDYTAAHGEDVASLAGRVALRMGLTPNEVRDVRYAAMLHDVGKIAVPSEILLKPGPLDDAEWEVMRRHATVGGELVSRIDAFSHLAPAVRASHERVDGAGYPDGLIGKAIPLAARIIAACDTYDAITTDRPYRKGRSPSQAITELQAVTATQLDTLVVEALLEELAATAVQPQVGESPTGVHARRTVAQPS